MTGRRPEIPKKDSPGQQCPGFFFIITFMNKFIAIVLLICTIAFADEDGVVPEVDRKRQIDPAVILGGFGYSSLDRIAIEGFILNGFQPFKNIGLYLEFSPRLDLRLDADEPSYGSLSVFLIAGMANLILQANESYKEEKEEISVAYYIVFGSLWLSSGTSYYALLGNNMIGLSIFENHLFEWWIDKDDWDMREVGFMESVGLQANLLFMFVGGGVQFEVTNRRRNLGVFFHIKLFPIFFERIPHE